MTAQKRITKPAESKVKSGAQRPDSPPRKRGTSAAVQATTVASRAKKQPPMPATKVVGRAVRQDRLSADEQVILEDAKQFLERHRSMFERLAKL